MREIHSDVGWKKSYAKLTLRENNTASLPSDFIDYYRIGICYGNQILALAENKNPCPISFNTDDCGQIQAKTLNGTFNSIDYSNEWDSYSKNGQFVGREFGVRGGAPMYGTFQIDENQGYIYVESQIINRDSLIMEYRSLLSKDESGNILVHPYETEAIKAWMYWKSIERLRSYAGQDKQLAGLAYSKEKKKARKRRNAMTLQEIVSANRKGYGAAPGI
ncbi:MAG: hypothetical protein ACW968_14945 [Candidatus Thorarchaeota archaeon]